MRKAICIHEVHLSPHILLCDPQRILRDQQKKKQSETVCHLLLSSGSLISLLPRTLLASSLVPSLASGITQLPVCTTLDGSWHVGLVDLGNWGGVDNWETGADGCESVLDGRDLLLGSISVLVLTRLAREEDQSAAVCLKTGNIDGQGLDGKVLAAGID